METERLTTYISRKGMSRRAFLKCCTLMASVVALPASEIPGMVESLQRV